MSKAQMYQVSTLQALMLGYSKGVVTVEELTKHGDTGLGTFQDVHGEMIVMDGKVYCADNEGRAEEAAPDIGVPFAAVADMADSKEFTVTAGSSIENLKEQLNIVVDEDFGINSMYVVRMDGYFEQVKARSEKGQKSHHIELSEILKKNQKDFMFEKVSGTLVCMYFPDYMDGINAAGWHFHFISDDKTIGGHVFDLIFSDMPARRKQIHNIQIQLPEDMAFDTYALKSVSKDDVKKVEQSK